METEDPRKALDDAKVTVRCAAARDLARIGTWDDVERLVAKAWSDRSMAVRLYAAAAAADVVFRHRGAFGQEALTPEQQAQVLRWAFHADPGTNPSMLMLAGAVEAPSTFERLSRIVRDPRSDVRLGVVTAIRRMVLSAVSDRKLVAERIGPWIEDDRLPDDTRAELAKLVGEAGLTGLRETIARLRRRGEALAEAVEVALERLDARSRPATWVGVWRSRGLDVFEVRAEPREDRLAITSETAWHDGGDTVPLRLHDGVADVGGRTATLVWATPLGATAPVLALQVDGRTWWQLTPSAAADALDVWWRALRTWPAEARAVLREAVDHPEAGAGAQRAAVIAAWLVGDAEGALARLDAIFGRKKPRHDLLWWRARVLADLGRTEQARADLDAFLEKARKGQPLVEEAEALRAELG